MMLRSKKSRSIPSIHCRETRSSSRRSLVCASSPFVGNGGLPATAVTPPDVSVAASSARSESPPVELYNGEPEEVELSVPVLQPLGEMDPSVLYEWDDLDIAKFLDALEFEEKASGVKAAGADCTDTTKAYSRTATRVINNFIQHLDNVLTYRELMTRVRNPFHTGYVDESVPTVIPKVFVDLSGIVSHGKIRLANRLVCSWQHEFKMQVPNAETKCPFYQPASQNNLVRVFFSAMNRRYGWVIGLNELSGFPGCLTAMLNKLYATRKEEYVSDCVSMLSLFYCMF